MLSKKYYDDPEYYKEINSTLKVLEAPKDHSWEFGLKYSMNPQAIMKGIIETLGELDTVSSR